MTFKLQFLGATGTVTGSKYLLQTDRARLLVDCGLFQGYKNLRLRNWAALPVRINSLDAVILTHAHLDHSGYLPLLVKNGFRGPVYCTSATLDLCSILLPDSGHLQEEEADFANRKHFSRHETALPLYTEQDAQRCLTRFRTVPFHETIELGSGLSFSFIPAGHILGSAMVALTVGTRRVVFTGDLGRPDDPVMRAPEKVVAADYLIVESTYGNRVHDPADPQVQLGQIVNETIARGGTVVIPTFAVGRAQSLMYLLHLLKAHGTIPVDLPIFLDSPMAQDATAIFHRHPGEHRLTPEQCDSMRHVAQMVTTPDQSKELAARKGSMIILAASGMATGGRVVHHLKTFAPDPANTILFGGFQAGGTRGAAMIAGAQSIKIHGAYVPLRARVAALGNLSAHADAPEILAWLRQFDAPPRCTFVTHGEPDAADALRLRIAEALHWQVSVPDYLQTVGLD